MKTCVQRIPNDVRKLLYLWRLSAFPREAGSTRARLSRTMGAYTGSKNGVTALRIANGSAVSLKIATEARDKGEATMPRGKTQRSLDLIDACYAILQEIHPATVRAVCYQLFIRRLLPSMAKTCTESCLYPTGLCPRGGDHPLGMDCG